jgi:hypothetical protein
MVGLQVPPETVGFSTRIEPWLLVGQPETALHPIGTDVVVHTVPPQALSGKMRSVAWQP